MLGYSKKENGAAILFKYSGGNRFSIHYFFKFVEGVPGIFIPIFLKIIIEGLDDRFNIGFRLLAYIRLDRTEKNEERHQHLFGTDIALLSGSPSM